MTRKLRLTAFAVLLVATAARADGLLFSYEGNTLPGDPASGFVIFDECEVDCSRHLEAGHFVLEWGAMGNLVNYSHVISESPDLPPPTLWVEWRFRSNQPKPSTSSSCDAFQTINYVGILDIAWMFEDAVVDNEGSDFVLGLSPDFHTYRFESLDGENYTFAVDGFVFNVEFDGGTSPAPFLQFGGRGSCVAPGPDRPVPVRNEWDFIRYGTIASGEQIVATDPPAGVLTEADVAGVNKVLVTFDGPNYVYVDDVAVTTTGITAPTVVATRRLDNGDPSVIEIELDRQIPIGVVTTITLTDDSGVQTIVYEVDVPPVPASSTWGAVVLALCALIAGSVLLAYRSQQQA